ncbi:alpha-acetolactate decarboxylase [Bifidobacterium sp. DSM 109959]|uniref:Alpha-acetolactate decarboxylase n=1 Tax=Bifidobacterium olomucense TaxID=2675324 RepID=A0A7Y0EVD3_9BIFI|nr:acetolactate decarboxylase [Bifidobacterium sp. DSM 109959]NMM97107.1 alpha-acetolactate decarboxylase [Bifidobacterium sp. DSM 109959]
METITVANVTQSLAKNIHPITAHDANVLYQHGTLALLVPGLLEGTTTIGELLKHGDTGIGTGEGLDGELIILDGVAYKIGQSGVAEQVPSDFTMPFANSHRAAFQFQCSREDIGLEALNERIVEANGRANTFFSVKVHGTFSFMKTRAVIKQQAPYPTLLEVADRQAIFLRHDVTGTMLGYFSPVMFHGAAVAGFHEHFLSDDHTFGGHVLDAVLSHGEIYSQVFDTLVTHLPVDDPEYRNHDFSQDNIAEAISSAEGDTAH